MITPSPIVNETSTASLFAACLRRTVDREGKAILCRPELLHRAFDTPEFERRLADRLGLPCDLLLRAEVLMMHGLRAVWMPVIEQYRIELIVTIPPPKKRTKRPHAKCPRCEQKIRYTPIDATGARVLDHHVFKGSRCPASMQDLDEARAEVNGKGCAA